MESGSGLMIAGRGLVESGSGLIVGNLNFTVDGMHVCLEFWAWLMSNHETVYKG